MANPWLIPDIPVPSFTHDGLATKEQLNTSVRLIPSEQSAIGVTDSVIALTNSGLVTRSVTLA